MRGIDSACPQPGPPTLVVVIDTEEEFDWSAPFDRGATSVENIRHQPLAQAVMDRHGVVPAYVVDYAVANDTRAAGVLSAIAGAGRCEIGAHLHPWVNPPHAETVNVRHSFPGNLPPELEREKLRRLRDRIAEAFGKAPSIYKAGRYGIGPSTYRILGELGFRIDASVVPHTDFSAEQGPDFRCFSPFPSRPSPQLVALPLSVHFVGLLHSAGAWLYPAVDSRLGRRLRAGGVLSRLGILERLRLSPEGHSLGEMARQTRAAIAQGHRYFMMTWHSSSLLPGATQYVRTEADRANFIAALDAYFRFFRESCGGRMAGVSEFAESLEGGPA